MTIATRILARSTQDASRLSRPAHNGPCQSLDTLLASIVASQAGAIERFEAGAAMIAGMLDHYEMNDEDRAALLALLRAHGEEIAAEKARLANLRDLTFVFPDDDGLLVVTSAA